MILPFKNINFKFMNQDGKEENELASNIDYFSKISKDIQ